MGLKPLEAAPVLPFSIVAKIHIPAIDVVETREFLRDAPFARFDNPADDLLAKQPRTDACTIWKIALAENATTLQLAARILGAKEDTPPPTLARLLTGRGHLMTLPQAEIAARILHCGAENLVFISEGAENTVSMHRLAADSRNIVRADDDPSLRVVDRILVRNLNASWPYV